MGLIEQLSPSESLSGGRVSGWNCRRLWLIRLFWLWMIRPVKMDPLGRRQFPMASPVKDDCLHCHQWNWLVRSLRRCVEYHTRSNRLPKAGWWFNHLATTGWLWQSNLLKKMDWHLAWWPVSGEYADLKEVRYIHNWTSHDVHYPERSL